MKEESNKLLLNKESRVDAFINGLGSKQYKFHFIITKPSIIDKIKRTAVHTTRKGYWIYILVVRNTSLIVMPVVVVVLNLILIQIYLLLIISICLLK